MYVPYAKECYEAIEQRYVECHGEESVIIWDNVPVRSRADYDPWL